MNLAARYRLADGVAIRPERFGGLVYRYDNRRLYFLHSHELVDFVSGLSGQRPLEEALDEWLASRELPETHRETLVKAVVQLDKLGILAEENQKP
ncbi:MAG: mycofactocin biosynthesis chaperone MftB [Candidatus Competibacter sp.]|nr:mycofactocin biosynthesis chaperone MftB [Candidatus Competibacter sp.]